MINHSFLKKIQHICLSICVLGALLALKNTATAQDRPNIVWLVSEDNSIHYVNHFSPGGASMPNIEALAKKGITFRRAFSQSPVCSVARSTLISSCYAPRIGVQYHRRTQKAPMPDGLEMFPHYLRKGGYYTSNNSKEDYNLLKSEEVWDESSRKASYKNRKSGQPFFHVQNFGTTHEGRLHFSEESMAKNPTITDPEKMRPFPYHPNTKTSRYTYAKYHDHHMNVDRQMGEFIKGLEEEGLMENTFIFYYGDHGGVLPRSKGYIYESGLHVPLVVYVPEKWKELVPVERGGSTNAFVRFIDFGPTVLNLAGVKIPEQVDGSPFLGKGISQSDLDSRNSIFSYADRFDEKYDLVRGLRKGKYKYLRNYQPFNFDGLHNFYRYKMLLFKEWRDMYHAGKLNEVQQQFFKPRAPEQLFDIEADPHETKNLAFDASYRAVLMDMRAEMNQQVKSMPDLSFIPEPRFIEEGISNPVQYGQTHKKDIAALVDIANLQVLPFAKAKKGIKKALKSKNAWNRYWGLIVCSSFGTDAASFYPMAKKLAAADTDNLVRARAAEFLALTKTADPREVILSTLKTATSRTEANLILNTAALLYEAQGHSFDLNKEMFDATWLEEGAALVMRRLEYLMKE